VLSEKPKLIMYCRNCWFPRTKPNLLFSSYGICSACLKAIERSKKSEDYWAKARIPFLNYVNSIRNRHPLFDVVVPVSGGKDSTVQVARMAELDLRILAVNVDYGIKTEIGKKNLENIARIGMTSLLTLRPALLRHTELITWGLENHGDPDLFSHMLLHAAPIHIARLMNIPFMLLGENSADLYGGSEEIAHQEEITEDWFKIFASIGFDFSELTESLVIHESNIRMYGLPAKGYEKIAKPKMFFMSNLWNWDSLEHLKIASTYGFQPQDKPVEGTFRNYVSLDEEINRVHQYIKLLKFGYGRSTDHANEEIRLGRMSRPEARDVILSHELTPLNEVTLDKVSNFLNIDKLRLCTTIERFRNMSIWTRSTGQDGTPRFHIPNFLELEEACYHDLTGSLQSESQKTKLRNTRSH
jgi:N-acetyl sugar amidotransferase